eukprot:2471843-Prymnesium_polylepis.1
MARSLHRSGVWAWNVACLGTWRARKLAERRGRALQRSRRIRWAGAAAAAAGCGLVGGADLLPSVQRMLVAMDSMFDPMVSKKSLLLLLLGAGSNWSFHGVPRWGRQGCTRCWVSLLTCRCRVESACVRSVRVQEQP